MYAERVRGCEGVSGRVVALREAHEYMGCTRGSGIACSEADVLGMSVVRGMRGVGGMCMCLARGGMGGEG